MHTFSYPGMPMYTHDQAAYIRQMYEWHTKMAQYYEQKRLFHLERAKHFQQMMGRLNVAAIAVVEDPKDGVA